MLKTLIKKQFLELNSFYFTNRKTGQKRSKGSAAGMIILFALVFLFLAAAFYGTASMLGDVLVPMGMGWLYFCMMGMIAIALGTFGSVFNTYAGLYHAKDNDLLLSMPIPPSKILFSRMTGVYGMSMLYSAIVWIPVVIKYFTVAEFSVLSLIFCILQTIIIPFFVTVLTCALGWVVALISTKLKNKSVVTVIASLTFIGLYYFVYFRINTFLQSIAQNAEAIGSKIKSVFYPFYLMGVASTGKVLPMIAVTAIVAALFALTYYILSRSFIKITTTKTAEKKAEYKSAPVKAANLKSALLRKEFKRFTSSSTYMLNCGIGLVIMLSLCIVALVKAKDIGEYLDLFTVMFPEMSDLLPAFAAAAICMMLSMNQITAPSVSLEGRNIWILQMLPVNPKDILDAKKKVHIILNAPVAIIAAIILGFVIKADFSSVIYMIVLAYAYVEFTASFGLFLNLKSPNLTWTNETVPVKQSAAVSIGMFGGWGISLLIGGAAYLLSNKLSIDMTYYVLACAIIILLAARFINKWLDTKGAEIFKSL